MVRCSGLLGHHNTAIVTYFDGLCDEENQYPIVAHALVTRREAKRKILPAKKENTWILR